jgi:hypothetical protein
MGINYHNSSANMHGTMDFKSEYDDPGFLVSPSPVTTG